ncbi:MAG: glycogen-binding domain-containing protein [Candidatus Margulisiibacteriota bacterium]
MAVKKAVKKTVAKTATKTPVKNSNGKNSLKSISVKFFNPDISSVSLVGDFNDWDPTKTKMKKNSNGEYVASIKLKPGSYAYKFLTSNGWITDPCAECVEDSLGNQNSLLIVM